MFTEIGAHLLLLISVNISGGTFAVAGLAIRSMRSLSPGSADLRSTSLFNSTDLRSVSRS